MPGLTDLVLAAVVLSNAALEFVKEAARSGDPTAAERLGELEQSSADLNALKQAVEDTSKGAIDVG